MSSLCPHQLQEYFNKVSDILDTYRSQILSMVKYNDIFEALLNRKVIRGKEHRCIQDMSGEGNPQMDAVLGIIKKRMWGIENFMTALIDVSASSWLSETLFQAYVTHLAVNIKKLQTQSICECFHGGNNSILYKSWIKALGNFDGYLYQIGTSLGFLTSAIHPVNGILDFIRSKLPISRQKNITLNPVDLESESSDGDDEVTLNAPNGQLQKRVNKSNNSPSSSAMTRSLSSRVSKGNPLKNTTGKSSYSTPSSLPKNPKLNNITSKSTSVKPAVNKSPISAKPNVIPRSKPLTNQSEPLPLKKTSSTSRTIKKTETTKKPAKQVTKSKSVSLQQGQSQTSTFKSGTYPSFVSISPYNSSDDEEPNLPQVPRSWSNGATRGSISSTVSQLTCPDLLDLWDDETFLPSPEPSESVSENNGNGSSTSTSVSSHTSTSAPVIRKSIKINGHVKTLGNPNPSLKVKPTSTDADHEEDSGNSTRPHSINSDLAQSVYKALEPTKPVETSTSCTQTIKSLDSSLKSNPEPVKYPVETVSVCTQTTPPNSPKQSRRYRSFPEGLYRLSQEFSNYFGVEEARNSIHRNPFRSFEVQKKSGATLTSTTESVRRGSARIVKPVEVSNGSSIPSPMVEKKPFLRKNSSRTSMVVKKITSTINSAVSSLKTGPSEKKLTRTQSTTTPKPGLSKTLPPRSVSVSSSISQTTDRKSRINSTGASPRKSLPTQNGKAVPSTSIGTKPSTTIAKPVLKKSVIPKPPEIPIKQRVQAELREQKLNAPPPPPPVNENRLSPQDYTSQQWCIHGGSKTIGLGAK